MGDNGDNGGCIACRQTVSNLGGAVITLQPKKLHVKEIIVF